MKDIIPAKKQSPILGLAGMGGGVGSNIVAGLAADPTYIDDVFSTYLYKGTGADQTINNGIKLGNGGAGNGVDFDGTGDYLSIPASNDLNLDGDFTIEAWVKVDDLGWSSTRRTLFANSIGWTTNHAAISLMNSASSNEENTIILYNNTSTIADSSPVRVEPSDGWTHIAITRSGSTIKIFKNGVQAGSTATYSGEFKFGTGETWIGAITMSTGSTPETYDGKISNLRVIKGTALYTSNFTPPTTALTSATNTKLLCCQSSTMTTATVTPEPIAVNGDPVPSSGPFTADDGEGGLIWMKDRDSGMNYTMMDTERGIDKILHSDGSWNQEAAAANDKANTFRSFNNNGFTLGNTGYVNTSGNDYTSWTFRKAKGFFDIVTYTGTGSARTVAHNLGSIPGSIFVKRIDGGNEDWVAYHRGMSDAFGNNPGYYYMYLNTVNTYMGGASRFNNTAATASEFTVGTDNGTNGNGFTYVAYVFAGGESPAATARSVEFDGTDDYLSLAASSDFTYGTGDFTVECWLRPDTIAGSQYFLNHGNDNFSMGIQSNKWFYYNGTANQHFSTSTAVAGQWTHFAFARSSGTSKIFINGIEEKSFTDSHNYSSDQATYIANYSDGSSTNAWDGKISNLRVVKGTALYTTSFKPSTKPLTNITNTKLLCCQSSTVTAATVAPGTITAHSVPTASTNSPFDDSTGYKFGANGDQNIIKCGSYKGNGDATNGIRVYVGFEPQWLLIKTTEHNEHWHQFDAMRGMSNNKRGQIGIDSRLEINNAGSETNTVDFIDIHPDGFTAYFTNNVNATNENFVYTAIRRPDGYVGKPATAGSDVFAMGRGMGTALAYPSGFPVDFGVYRDWGTTGSWWNSNRLTQLWERKLHDSSEDSGWSGAMFDSNNRWVNTSHSAGHQSWMWKRHAGFDVVVDEGNGQTTKNILHSLGVVPQMIWRKNRNGGSDNWQVYHYMLNGGTTPHLWRLRINTNNSQANDPYTWVNAPTDTHFTVGSNGSINRDNDKFITMLFASVEGVSKVGYYDGSDSDQTISTGFSPRFLIIKRLDQSESWIVLDTRRGWGAGNDQALFLDTDAAPSGGLNLGEPTSTGFTVSGSNNWVSTANGKFIYYAHA